MTPLILSARLTFTASLLIATAASAQDSATSKAQPKTLQTRVWVNLNTRVYHCPGNRYYGKTRNGEFMEEAQARGNGIRANTEKGCANVVTPARAPLPNSTAASKRMVWLNTESGIYHCPNSARLGRNPARKVPGRSRCHHGWPQARRRQEVPPPDAIVAART